MKDKALDLLVEKLISTVDIIDEDRLYMFCLSPLGKAFHMGDLVPMGFLLMALRKLSKRFKVGKYVKRVEEKLLKERQGSLWSFHTGRLVTATDSSLVLLGFLGDPKLKNSAFALDIFFNGKEGYLPQLYYKTRKTMCMGVREEVKHWCQVDYGTTCFVSLVQKSFGLPMRASVKAFLEEKFEKRGGLFFANPYITDWALSTLFTPKTPLGERLLSEVLGSQNQDGSFGLFDKQLSTSLAILTLKNMGYSGDPLSRALEWLSASVLSKGLEESIPFYSSSRIFVEGEPELIPIRACRVGSELLAVTYYKDLHSVITGSLSALALLEEARGSYGEAIKPLKNPMYGHKDHLSYILSHALSLYVAWFSL